MSPAHRIFSFPLSFLAGLSFLCVSVSALLATSCSSSKEPKGAARPEAISFATHIQPLVQGKCQSCHRDGGIAPFPLVTYADVKGVAETARAKIEAREMPPWGPFPDPNCTPPHGFKDDLSLSDEQIRLFGEWVDHGMPSGDLSKVPTAAQAMATTGELDAKTDSIESGGDYVVEGGAADDLRCFPVDPGFTEDVWVAESIAVPGDPKVVHHALIYLDEKHEGIGKAGADGSYKCFGGPELSQNALLLAWSPGGMPTVYGDGAGLRIPKGAHLVMQVHFHPIATSTTGRMTVQLRRLPQRPARVASFVLVGNGSGLPDDPVKLLPGPNDPKSGPAFVIPPNVKEHTETMEFAMPEDARISAVGAHMHWAGVALKLEVEPKSAAPESCLLSTTYDFNWQRTFVYDTPIANAPLVRTGDKLRITCTYDNTMDNPRIAKAMRELRRNSPQKIVLGGQSTDEMCQAVLVLIE